MYPGGGNRVQAPHHTLFTTWSVGKYSRNEVRSGSRVRGYGLRKTQECMDKNIDIWSPCKNPLSFRESSLAVNCPHLNLMYQVPMTLQVGMRVEGS